MTKRSILLVVGARPNFMKVAPVLRALKEKASDEFTATLVHTGQHYDANMSDVFFSDLDLPAPDIFLGVGSGSHAEQTAKVMIAMEKLLSESRPDLIMVAGDVNSTLASTLVSAKLNIPIAHIESGLRSFDRGMPEEINRIVADEFSRFCFVTEQSGLDNLGHEGISSDRIFFVGNTMIDSVDRYIDVARERFTAMSEPLKIRRNGYALITLHRPSNVDEEGNLKGLIELFDSMSRFAERIVFPIHPRTRKRLTDFGLISSVEAVDNLVLMEPVGYLEFLALQDGAAVILTDSGGIQEESTALGRPCITLRENTERPSTVEIGSNELVGSDYKRVVALTKSAFAGTWKRSTRPALWDGRAAERIVEVLRTKL